MILIGFDSINLFDLGSLAPILPRAELSLKLAKL
jgi:hypothetical protein